MQLKSEKIYIGEIPVYVVHPIREGKGPVIFYHGWSSNALAQMSRAALLAVNGYTVYLPEALHHGERDPLEDYYVVEDYPVFWNTIFNHIFQYPVPAYIDPESCLDKQMSKPPVTRTIEGNDSSYLIRIFTGNT